MSPKRFALLVLRDACVWLAISCTQALSADEAAELEEEERDFADLEERLKGWEIN